MKPAYPYFGSKAQVADVIWEAFGDVPNYVEPFAGSVAVHLARPHRGKVVTLNELNGFITNFLRAIAHAPEEVAQHACTNVNEIDMHARHAWLRKNRERVHALLLSDPEAYDAKVAGWWVWGQSIWIGAGWCDDGPETRKLPIIGGQGGAVQRGYPKKGVGIFRDMPTVGQVRHLSNRGCGVFRETLDPKLPHLIGPHNARKLGQLPSLIGGDGSGVGYGRGIFATGRREDLFSYFSALSSLLEPERVRIVCGDWSRVVTPAVTISHGLTGVFLDPPYEPKLRTKKLYAHDAPDVSAKVREWAIANGDNPLLRTALCGYEGEHDMPESWRCFSWKARGGYGNQDGENKNAAKERIWFSPHCLSAPQQLSLL